MRELTLDEREAFALAQGREDLLDEIDRERKEQAASDRFNVTMRQPETGDTVIVEVAATSQFHARDEAQKALPFHGVVHVQQVHVQQVQS